MKRRDFLKTSAPLAVVPFFSGRLLAAAMPVSLLEASVLNNTYGDRVLVVVQINGGNDGLNMVLPLDQYTNLAAARSNILIPETSALVLGNTQTGLHPAMTGMHDLFEQDKMNVIQGVSYPSPNFSHFRATDIFMSGSDSASVVESGWLGRFLQFTYPDFPAQYPNAVMPDPLSISIGSELSLGLQGYEVSTGQTVPTNFSGNLTSLLPYSNTTVPNTNAGIEIAFLRNQQQFTNQYGSRIVAAWNAGSNSLTYPASPSGINNNLGQQLRIVARLIKGGLKTRIFWVKATGYDTHANQVSGTDNTQGVHANLLSELSTAISTFQADLQALDLADRVLGMTFSEFGRRIRSNGSIGTDHGSGYPVFLFGNHVLPGIIGTNPVIPTNPSTSASVPMQHDFHSIYLSILQEWFCLSEANANAVLGFGGAPLSTINASCAPLPVQMTHFMAEKSNETAAHLDWATASEDGSDIFEVERSTDGTRFTKIGMVEAQGHSHQPQQYEFLDTRVPLHQSREFFYRLKIVDVDNTYSYTEIRVVHFGSANDIFGVEVAPNPTFNGSVNLRIHGQIMEDAMTEITVTDSYGRLVSQQSQQFADDAPFWMNLGGNATPPPGIYFVTVRQGSLQAVRKVVVR